MQIYKVLQLSLLCSWELEHNFIQEKKNPRFGESNIFHIIRYSGTSKIRKFMFYEFKQKSKLHSDAKHCSLFTGILQVKGSKMFNYNFELCVSLNCYKLSTWFGENNWLQLCASLFNLFFLTTFIVKSFLYWGKKSCAICIYCFFCKLKSSSVN